MEDLSISVIFSAILGLEYGDFLIWSGLHGFATEIIYRDEIFISRINTKVSQSVYNFYC